MKRHAFDPISFIFGATFAVIGIVFVATDTDVVDLGWRWLWPAALIFFGTLFLTVALKRVKPEDPEEPGDSAEE